MPQPIVETSKDLAIIHDGGAYQSSLLLIDEFWNRFHFRGDLVVFVVSRDVLLVTGMKESEGLPAAANYARDLIKTVPYPISNVPILHRNGKWKTFPGMN